MTQDLKKTSISKRNSLSISFLLLSVACIAQTPPVNEPDYTKPALFSDFPDTLVIDEPALLSLFNKSLGDFVEIKIGGSFDYQGSVQSVMVCESPRRISLIIKSTNKPGSALYITKITDPLGQVTMRGRIISHQHIDAYDLAYIQGRGYRLQKNNYYKLVSE
jgi:hypothetical protein